MITCQKWHPLSLSMTRMHVNVTGTVCKKQNKKEDLSFFVALHILNKLGIITQN